MFYKSHDFSQTINYYRKSYIDIGYFTITRNISSLDKGICQQFLWDTASCRCTIPNTVTHFNGGKKCRKCGQVENVIRKLLFFYVTYLRMSSFRFEYSCSRMSGNEFAVSVTLFIVHGLWVYFAVRSSLLMLLIHLARDRWRHYLSIRASKALRFIGPGAL